MIKASYRFFANAKVSESAMSAPHIEHTLQRIKAFDTVLLLQDSTYLDYNMRAKTAGLDLTLRSKNATASEGLILHNTLVVTVEGTFSTEKSIKQKTSPIHRLPLAKH